MKDYTLLLVVILFDPFKTQNSCLDFLFVILTFYKMSKPVIFRMSFNLNLPDCFFMIGIKRNVFATIQFHSSSISWRLQSDEVDTGVSGLQMRKLKHRYRACLGQHGSRVLKQKVTLQACGLLDFLMNKRSYSLPAPQNLRYPMVQVQHRVLLKGKTSSIR